MSGGLVFVGCYTPDSGGGHGAGIVAARRDPASGLLEPIGVAAETPSPSFLASHPTLPVLYAVNEVTEGAVSAFAIGTDGSLAALGSRPTGGAEPCHLAVTPDGRFLLSANYGSGSIAVHPLDEAGGLGERAALVRHSGGGPVADRQEGPHAHMVRPEADRVLAVDLGADRIFRYRLGPDGELSEAAPAVELPAGTGPRHVVRHPDGRYFLVGELDGTVTMLGSDLAGRERVPASAQKAAPSEIAVGPGGRFIYVGNRGPDTVTVLDASNGARVGEVGAGGQWPRHLAVIGEHLYVANERSASVAVFRLGADDGIPVPAGALETPSPTCVLFAENT